MSILLNVHMSKVMHTLIQVGVCTYATYANCGTLTDPRLSFAQYLETGAS